MFLGVRMGTDAAVHTRRVSAWISFEMRYFSRWSAAACLTNANKCLMQRTLQAHVTPALAPPPRPASPQMPGIKSLTYCRVQVVDRIWRKQGVRGETLRWADSIENQTRVSTFYIFYYSGGSCKLAYLCFYVSEDGQTESESETTLTHA